MIFLGELGESGEITVICRKHVNTFAANSGLSKQKFSACLTSSAFKMVLRKQEKILLFGIVKINIFFLLVKSRPDGDSQTNPPI